MTHTTYLARLAALRARYRAGELSHKAYLDAVVRAGERYRQTRPRTDKGAA